MSEKPRQWGILPEPAFSQYKATQGEQMLLIVPKVNELMKAARVVGEACRLLPERKHKCLHTSMLPICIP